MIYGDIPEENFAHIIVHQHELPYAGSYYLTYEWVGEPWQLIRLPRHFLEGHDLPWDLEVLEDPLFTKNVICVRRDAVPFYAYARFQRDVLAIVDFCRGVGYRSILTLSIWGLAEIPQYAIPQVSDVKWGRVLLLLGMIITVAIVK